MFVCHLGLFFILLQAGKSFGEETEQCQPGFSTDTYVFKVTRKILERGRVLGKVRFDDCTGRKLRPYNVEESRFRIAPDGTVSLKRPVQLHDGLKAFTVHTWDSAGKKYSAEVAISTEETQHAEPSEPQVMYFPKSQKGLHRRKRDWIIPFTKLSENEKGPFPKRLVQIKSSIDKETKVFYSITGQGVDTPPEGIFTIERSTGQLYVTRPLDRETLDKYIIFAHVVSESGKPVEYPMEIIIKVTDENDNSPVFTQAIFEGEVHEGAKPGTYVMQVSATDADDAKDTYNGVLYYRIIDQAPKTHDDHMFTINKDTGVISVISTRLDHEKVPKYTLKIQAADSEGHGLMAMCTAVIKVIPRESSVSKNMSASSDSPLTTHVLNTASGTPAKGLRLQLSLLDNPTQRWVELTTSFTNSDGRCPGILSPERFTAGTYKLRFETGEFWKQLEQISFYPYVEVVFTILDPGQKYHIPLLMSPFSYTTYRGS